jgi:hypothetical protein
MQNNPWLIAAGSMSASVALAHLAVIAGGPAWYRFFGAGERMARAVERGQLSAALVTIAIAAVLSVWSAYAFSGAGLIPRLPLLRLGLAAITAIYLVRGLWIIPGLPLLGRSPTLVVVSSMIVLVIGVTHAIGVWTAWRTLN